MSVSNPPSTGDANLDFTLLELIRALNERQEEHLKLLADIRAASSLADLKERIDKK